VAPIGRLSENIPDVVQLGFHFCFGTFGGWPVFAPADLTRTIELVNAAVASVPRRVDWIHIPTLDTLNEAFYAPLANLDVKGARVYSGGDISVSRFCGRKGLIADRAWCRPRRP
jgi:hypothetical protein